MDSVARTGAPSLANRRRRIAASTMIALPDLVRNPVALTAIDAEGPHAISAERGPGGKVWLTCQCSASVEEGWCSHRLDLLCSRYDAVKGSDAATLRAFEQITGGTSLSEAGHTADRALNAFDECLAVFDKRRPAKVTGRDLGKFTDLISDLAACASELEDSLGTLRRLLERS